MNEELSPPCARILPGRLLTQVVLAGVILGCNEPSSPSQGGAALPAGPTPGAESRAGVAPAPPGATAPRAGSMTAVSAGSGAGEAPSQAAGPPATEPTPSAPPGEPGAPGATDTPPPTAASDAPDPSPGCSGGTLEPGERTKMMESGGTMHEYVEYVPKSYDGKTPVPLLFDLHGGSFTGPRWAAFDTGFKPLSETENYIYLAPSAASDWLAETPDSTDGQFLRDLIVEMGKNGCIDRKRVYTTGCSMGGAMSFWLACFASDLVAAAAPLCGSPFFDIATACKPERAVPFMFTIGETDPLNCWDGTRDVTPCAKQAQAAFKTVYSCTDEPEQTHMNLCETLDECRDGSEVTICKVNSGHSVYGNPDMDIAQEHWDFLMRFQLP
jgi:poly(3-hydroxybutyrate) depolymerase